MLEEGEDFVECAGRELYEETGIRATVEVAWWARVEPWRAPDDPELYAGVGFTWYTERESDVLWKAIREMQR
jgi:8-oxo-dGTP pyrophosphatase MutT (NUDIX family)